MKIRLYILTFFLVALVVTVLGYVGMTLSLDYMQEKYIELQLDINQRQAQTMAMFLENQLSKGASEEEVRTNFQQSLKGTDAEKGFLCMFDKYDAELICHPDESKIGMQLPASMNFENNKTGEIAKTRNIILEGLANGGLFHTQNATEVAYMIPVKGTSWMLSAHENIETIKTEISSQKNMFLIGFGIISFITALLATLMARLVGRKYEKKIEVQNITLENANEELNTINNELASKNAEISMQKTVIEDQHEHVQSQNEELKSINEQLNFKNQEISLQKTVIEDQHNHVQSQNEELTTINEQLNFKNQEISLQKSVIEDQHEHVQNQNEQITSSIQYASRIQEALLPPANLLNEAFVDSFVFFKPRDIVSGDFYWLRKINDTVIFVVADSTGHGVPGAFMSMLGIAFLNEIVSEETHDFDSCSSSLILNDLRDRIKDSLRQTGEDDQTKDGMDMAIIMLDTKTNIVQFSGAYNPLYIVRNKKLTEVQADKMPVGVYLKDQESFTNKKAQLQKGDKLYMFSDGYYDQFGGEAGRKFMKKPFRELIQEISEKPMNEQKEILETKFNEWKGDTEQADDILIAGIRI